MRQGKPSVNGTKTLVAVGGNDENARETVPAALSALQDIFAGLSASKLYQTPAFPAGSGADFVNAACVFDTDMAPRDILSLLHRIEADFGRKRTTRWGPRSLDLDLIAYGQQVLPDTATYGHWRALPPDAQKTDSPDTLILPHPRLQDRLFVLVPLADVAPDWHHPMLGRTIADLVATYPTPQRRQIRLLSP